MSQCKCRQPRKGYLRYLIHLGNPFSSLSLLNLLFNGAKSCLVSALPCIQHKSFASPLIPLEPPVAWFAPCPTEPTQVHLVLPSAEDQPVACPAFLPLPNVKEAHGAEHGTWLPEKPSKGSPPEGLDVQQS